MTSKFSRCLDNYEPPVVESTYISWKKFFMEVAKLSRTRPGDEEEKVK